MFLLITISSHILYNISQINFLFIHYHLRIFNLFPLLIIPKSFYLKNKVFSTLINLQTFKCLLFNVTFITMPHILLRQYLGSLKLLQRFHYTRAIDIFILLTLLRNLFRVNFISLYVLRHLVITFPKYFQLKLVPIPNLIQPLFNTLLIIERNFAFRTPRLVTNRTYPFLYLLFLYSVNSQFEILALHKFLTLFLFLLDKFL